MGLDFKVENEEGWVKDCHWAYSGFMSFRIRLAKEIGIENLREMKDFGGEIPWDRFKDNPLYPLLYHSDCDGELTPDECALVYPVLRRRVTAWEDCYDKENGLALAYAMNYCAATNQKLLFT